jgi:hypothetical protein
VNSEEETFLQHYAYEMREKAEAEYWQAAVKAEAARRIAKQGPDEEPLSPHQAEHLAALLLRARALEQARYVLYYAPSEAPPGIHDRWPTVAALNVASRALSEEMDAYKREIGFK